MSIFFFFLAGVVLIATITPAQGPLEIPFGMKLAIIFCNVIFIILIFHYSQ